MPVAVIHFQDGGKKAFVNDTRHLENVPQLPAFPTRIN